MTADEIRAEERGRIVQWLMCEAFEHRFSPETARVCTRLADGIAQGRHYMDSGYEDPQSTAVAAIRAGAISEARDIVDDAVEKLRAVALELAEAR